MATAMVKMVDMAMTRAVARCPWPESSAVVGREGHASGIRPPCPTRLWPGEQGPCHQTLQQTIGIQNPSFTRAPSPVHLLWPSHRDHQSGPRWSAAADQEHRGCSLGVCHRFCFFGDPASGLEEGGPKS